MVTTNIRLPEDDYKQYRKLALEHGKSFAQLVRLALKTYQKIGLEHETKKRMAKAASWLWENRIPVNTSTKKLIEYGRKI